MCRRDPASAAAETLVLERDVLSANDARAAVLRDRFQTAQTHVINVVSSPGSGKTSLLTRLLGDLVDGGIRAAALVADCATDNDAVRLGACGAPVRQIVTDSQCHLEAGVIEDHLAAWSAEGLALRDIDVLVIENIGNLVCPAGFDLGEAERWVMLSVTEGEDKPLKYPAMFAGADLAVVTKVDLAEPCRFDRSSALAAIQTVNPGADIVQTSAFTGDGCDVLTARLRDAVDRHADAARQPEPSAVTT